jgi:formylglycine-generating enzyme required for sulfatase activity
LATANTEYDLFSKENQQMKKRGILFVLIVSVFSLSACQTAIEKSEPEVGSTMISNKDGMTLLYVPAGKFIMGSNPEDALVKCQNQYPECELYWLTNEQPLHEVNLSAFWIDQTEVTNAMYAKCVADGVCIKPNKTRSYSRSTYYGNSEFDNYPVIYVDWDMAKTYCEWAGRQLPTEAQWEKAASWDEYNQVKRTYPWGDTLDCSFANYSSNKSHKSCVGDTTAVKSYESGKSFYGAYDMAGNVEEWVNDWYGANYYQNSASSNPSGPNSGIERVSRGGSWYYGARSAYRNGYIPTLSTDYVGFRCSLAP